MNGTQTQTLRLGRFGMDVYGDTTFYGYTDGDTWNGWSTPLFDWGTACDIVDAHNGLTPVADPDDKPTAWYDYDTDTFCFITEGNDRQIERYQAVTYTIGDYIVDLYAIGTYFWTWMEAE